MRLHLMTYIDIRGFLKSPEKALLSKFSNTHSDNSQQLLFITSAIHMFLENRQIVIYSDKIVLLFFRQ
jgi:hypothetical protein